MTGFIVSSLRLPVLKEYKGYEIQKVGRYEILFKPDSKFKADKVCAWDKGVFFLLNGVILNSKELMEDNQAENMTQLCKALYEKLGGTFHNCFIGNYAGLVYDEQADKLAVFTNKLSSLQLFYYDGKEGFVASSLITDIAETLKHHKIGYSFNRDAAYLMMTYGYMGTDDTFIREVKKINAGHQIEKKGDSISEDVCYHRFTNHKYDLSKATEEEIIEGIDERFRKAIKREYEKDLETDIPYYFRSLTAGTDSRACAFVARDLGFSDVVNYTIGIPGNYDERIAREISDFYGENLAFISNLPFKNQGSFLKKIDETTYKTQGNAYYLEVAQSAISALELNEESFALSHGGSFSEAFLTTGYLKDPKNEEPREPLHVYSRMLIDKCPKEHLKLYENEDIYSIYSIFLNKHVPTGRNLLKPGINTAYPGLDDDLVSYCLSIPLELRKRYYIYHKWLFTKCPEAANFKLEKLNARPKDSRIRKHLAKYTRYGSLLQYVRCSKDPLPKKLRERFELDKKIKPGKQALMPFDWWFDQNPEIRQYISDYLEDNITNPVLDDELRADIRYMFDNGLARPKSMALTVLAAAKLYF